MTAHTAALSIDRTPLSDSDAARVAAEDELHASWARRAARVVAASSDGAVDCRTLLSILGIDLEVVAAARAELPPKPAARKRRPRAA